MQTAATRYLPFHKPLIDESDIAAVTEVMRSGWLTTGARAREFEAAFARYVGATHALALNSCTAALHLALAAVGVMEGDEVVLPTMTFAATGEVVHYFKARPVLVDCSPHSFQADPAEIERAIGPRTRAIMVVHYGGAAADLEAILGIARRHGIRVIEDAAHALPTRYRGRLIGSLSDVTCFSFYATKTLTTGEGGMATTENPEYAEHMRLLSLHGISRDAYKRYTAEGSWRYEILEVGYKYNLTDMQAALGLRQLAKCDAMRARREEIATRYTRHLASVEAYETPGVPPDGEHAWHLYPIQLNLRLLTVGRDRVIEELKQRGVGTSVHFIPLHLHSLYQRGFGYSPGQFPNAERQFQRAVSLPIYASMTDEDVDFVLDALDDVARTFRH